MDGGWSDLHAWRIDRAAPEPLFRQIYGQIRDSIRARALAPGTRLPSTRELAARLGVSRTSAIVAFEQLTAEGWLTSRRGSGAYVCDDLPEPFAAPPAGGPASPASFAPDPEDLFGPIAPADEWPGERPFT